MSDYSSSLDELPQKNSDDNLTARTYILDKIS